MWVWEERSRLGTENPPVGRKVYGNVGPVEGVADLDVRMDGRGVVRVPGFPAGSRPTVVLRTFPEGLVRLGRDLEPGNRPIHARLGPGRTITGRIHSAGKGQHPTIAATTDWLTISGVVMKDLTFVIRAVPQGLFTVRAWAGTGSETRVIVPAGGSTVLTFPEK